MWRVPIPVRFPARAMAWLSAAESDRARRYYQEQDALRFTSVRAAARCILAANLRVAPEQVEWVESPVGKPSVPVGPGRMVEFNVAHSGDLGLVAVSTLGPVGVDVESIHHAAPHLEAIEPFLGTDEQRAAAMLPPVARSRFLLESWVLREAVVKAMGVGLGGVDLRDLQRPRGSGTGIVRIPVPAAFDHRMGWWLQWLEVGPDYVAAVVTAGCPERFEIRDFDWTRIP